MSHVAKCETEEAYFRSDLLEKRRQLMATWGEYCTMAPADYGEVVPLHRGISA
jgi:hypothetical protein